MCTVQYIKFLTFLFGGGGGGGGTKFSQNIAQSFAESFAKVLAKFHKLKISTKPQHYMCGCPYVCRECNDVSLV